MKRTIMLAVAAMSLTLGSTGAYANAVWGTLTQSSSAKLAVTSVPGPPIPDPWLTVTSVPGPPIPDPWLTVNSNNAVWGTVR